jgi:hypothetical protein
MTSELSGLPRYRYSPERAFEQNVAALWRMLRKSAAAESRLHGRCRLSRNNIRGGQSVS